MEEQLAEISESIQTNLQAANGRWLASPLTAAIFSAIFGLVGTGIGAALQGHSNLQLERQKYEFSLIQKALEVEDREEAAKKLLFLVELGAIKSLNAEKIQELTDTPDNLPAF